MIEYLRNHRGGEFEKVKREGRSGEWCAKVPSVKDLKTITGRGVKSAAEDAAKKGVVFENDSPTEVLEVLRYFGPEVNPDAPELPR